MANDYQWRSTKAKKQLRDRFGRWISLGANVRYRGDGAEQSGVVTSVVDGKAYVDQKNRDGSVTQKILTASQIRVLASKATLPPNGKKIFDPNNNFSNAMKREDYKKALSSGNALIERADGYALAANLVDEAQGNSNVIMDGTERNEKTGGNPIMYQLFAPGGVSLGTYSQGAEADFDDMVIDHMDQGQEADESPEGGEAPDAESGPVTASSDIIVGDSKTYRVPESVRATIASALELGVLTDPSDIENANALAFNDKVSLSEVNWISNYFESVEPEARVRGGYDGKKWAAKIISPAENEFSHEDIEPSTHPKYAFDDETFAYFAVGQDSGSSLVDNLISVDYETGAVYTWTADGFTLIEGMDITDVDEPQIIPIDEMTADEFAHWLDSGQEGSYDLLDVDAEERNLFTLAESEIDFDELDRSFAIIAAGATDGVYTPVERSQNAKTQRRGAGGKFGSSPDEAKPVEGQGKPAVKKARLPIELPLVADPAARIAEWVSTAAEAPVVAAGEPEPTEGYSEEDQAVEDAATGPTDEALYFAIVDPVDKTAVMDAIAIVKQNGQPSAYIRANGAWVASPDTLQSLQGSTPPAVAELPDPQTVKTVLQQIDQFDAEKAPEATEALAASGYAMPDGTYGIIDSSDLESIVTSFSGTEDVFVKAHVRKRARALNRMDLVPEAWREFSLAEIGELSAAKTLYGEFGEIIVAAGVPGIADTPSDFKNVAKLQAYWTTGKGALKIRWGTKGDLTRAHRHLSKYVGPQRAWGLAQKYHKSLFGVYNHTHDVATGQYVPRRRKK